MSAEQIYRQQLAMTEHVGHLHEHLDQLRQVRRPFVQYGDDVRLRSKVAVDMVAAEIRRRMRRNRQLAASLRAAAALEPVPQEDGCTNVLSWVFSRRDWHTVMEHSGHYFWFRDLSVDDQRTALLLIAEYLLAP